MGPAAICRFPFNKHTNLTWKEYAFLSSLLDLNPGTPSPTSIAVSLTKSSQQIKRQLTITLSPSIVIQQHMLLLTRKPTSCELN